MSSYPTYKVSRVRGGFWVTCRKCWIPFGPSMRDVKRLKVFVEGDESAMGAWIDGHEHVETSAERLRARLARS